MLSEKDIREMSDHVLKTYYKKIKKSDMSTKEDEQMIKSIMDERGI